MNNLAPILSTIITLSGLIPLSLRYTILLGSNKSKFWDMEAKENKQIMFNKNRQRTRRLAEFIFRSGVIWTFIMLPGVFNSLAVRLSINTGNLLSKKEVLVLLLVAFYGFCVLVQTVTFKNGLIGINPDSKRAKLEVGSLWVINLLGAGMLYICSTYKGTLLGLITCPIYAITLILIIAILLINLDRYTVYKFKSGSIGTNVDNILLDRDIYIIFNNSDIKMLNLLTTNLYICENDDILLISLSKNKKELVKEHIRKTSIRYIAVGKVRIKYNGIGWEKATE